jgi:hypothetical protein
VTNKSFVNDFPCVLDAGGQVHHALQSPAPQVRDALAGKEAAQHGDQTNHFIKAWRRLRRLLTVENECCAPFISLKQQRCIELEAGSSRRISQAIRHATTIQRDASCLGGA